MRGQIVVKDLKSLLFDIEVQVGEIVALHNSSSRKPSNSGSSDCQTGSTTPISQCSAVHPLPDNLLSSGFTFWKCSTPEVTSISPNIGTSSTILTIKGKGFGLLNCQNEVRIGSRGCFVQTSSEDTITCLVTPGLQLSSGKSNSWSYLSSCWLMLWLHCTGHISRNLIKMYCDLTNWGEESGISRLTGRHSQTRVTSANNTLSLNQSIGAVCFLILPSL